MGDQELTPRTLSRAPALTGIRAVAIGLVILVHTNVSVAEGGWIGVDVFFVLSGFLITALLLNEHDANGQFSIPKFYVRRIFRLVPAYWAFILILVVWAAIWRSGAFGSWSSEAVKSATYQMNFFDINHFPQIGIGQTWSLAIEEQFYLVWPLLLLVGLKFVSRRVFTGLVVIGILASFVATVIMAHHGVSYRRLYYGLDTNALPLLVGCLAGILYTGGYVRKMSAQLSAFIPFVTVVVLALFLISVPEQSEWAYEGPIQLVSLLTAATVFAILLNPDAWAAKILAHPWVVFIGLISYSLYLWNAFAMLLARHLATGSVGRGLHLLVGVILTFGFALASYYLVERPGLRLKDRFEVYRGGRREAASPAEPSHSRAPEFGDLHQASE
jgi:peptidoglycan/LPS O-acetylase OafA/YrhL